MNGNKLDIRFEETGKSGVNVQRSLRRFAEKQLNRWIGGELLDRNARFHVIFRRNPHSGQVDCRVNARINHQSFFGCGFGSGPQQALTEAISRLQIIARPQAPLGATA